MFPASSSSKILDATNYRPQPPPNPSSAALMATPASMQPRSADNVLPGSAERDARAGSVPSGMPRMALSTSRSLNSNSAVLFKHHVSGSNSCIGIPEDAPAVRREPERGQQKHTSDQPKTHHVHEMKEPRDLSKDKYVPGLRSPLLKTTLFAKDGRVTSTTATTAGSATTACEETASRNTYTMNADVASTTERETETSGVILSGLPSVNLSTTIASNATVLRANQRVSSSSGTPAGGFHQQGALSGNTVLQPSRDPSPAQLTTSTYQTLEDQQKQIDVHETNEPLAGGTGLHSTSRAPAPLSVGVARSLQQPASTSGAACTHPLQRVVRFEISELGGTFRQRVHPSVPKTPGDVEDLASPNGLDPTEPPSTVASETISSAQVSLRQLYPHAPVTSTKMLTAMSMLLRTVEPRGNPADAVDIEGLSSVVLSTTVDGEDLASRNGVDPAELPSAVALDTLSSAQVPLRQLYPHAPVTSTKTLPAISTPLRTVEPRDNTVEAVDIGGLSSVVPPTTVSVELTSKNTSESGKGCSRNSKITADNPGHHQEDNPCEGTVALPERPTSRGQLNQSPGQPKEDVVHDKNVRQEEGKGRSTVLRSSYPTTLLSTTATSTPQQQTPERRTAVVDPVQVGISHRENNSAASESSRAIVLYTGGHRPLAARDGTLHVSPHELGNMASAAPQFSPFNPLASPNAIVPLHSSRNKTGPRRDGAAASSVQSGFSERRSTTTPFGVGSRRGPADRLDAARALGQRSEWVVISAEQAEQAAKKLRDEADKNRVLESTIKKHNRDRVLIYDAAMKQAAKREEEGVSEVKQTFEREQSTMRAEVDRELGKINDLYHERCRDYAQMVTEECEDEVSKTSAGLRKDWAQQKKTIAQLVRNGGDEDRQVTAIARAVTEQLQEEKKDELAALREDIYADVKMEFEQREAALRDALQSDFQADLDGQLLLAEIRHQKEMDQLRTELGRVEATPLKVAAGSIVVWNQQTPTGASEGRTNSDAPPTAPYPSVPGRSLHQKIQVNAAAGGRGRPGAAASGKPVVLGKRSSFKTPAQKAALDDKTKATKMPPHRSASKPTPTSRIRTKNLSRTPAIGKRVARAKNAVSQVSPENDNIAPGSDEEDAELDGGITSALMVSPTKAMPGMVAVTPSEDSEGTAEPPRPKKRAKRLFSA